MARQKKTRKISDIMPVRRTDKAPPMANVKSKKGRKPTRYELDVQAREEKRKKKHKGLDAGSRHSAADKNSNKQSAVKADPRVGSRKKIPLMIEMVNKPEKGKVITPIKPEPTEIKKIDPMLELEQLENNECLNELLDQLDAGKTLSAEDQQFVDDCLRRIEQLMQELGLNEEDEDENSEDALYRTFNTIDINKFR
ncbi:Der GTPase-activating protein YihI [Pasteurellaceae bacterium USgator11]|nr:Der GTPase-activating protein YihI [Pasteurellaceae bacterium UScroc12]TNG96524.1 Der GTPase-activating protein YihI [Pasteurellaceae bacterium USgator41]TNH01342.1 Der GTPase-activating protein YihI [Pasteurellaceae bacterium USgator11]TNH01451.1 Der GTPase-activating protein YihI [Pasteurellaceae bacterium UScroc31]